jgi:hypothetical protein
MQGAGGMTPNWRQGRRHPRLNASFSALSSRTKALRRRVRATSIAVHARIASRRDRVLNSPARRICAASPRRTAAVSVSGAAAILGGNGRNASATMCVPLSVAVPEGFRIPRACHSRARGMPGRDAAGKASGRGVCPVDRQWALVDLPSGTRGVRATPETPTACPFQGRPLAPEQRRGRAGCCVSETSDVCRNYGGRFGRVNTGYLSTEWRGRRKPQPPPSSLREQGDGVRCLFDGVIIIRRQSRRVEESVVSTDTIDREVKHPSTLCQNPHDRPPRFRGREIPDLPSHW